MTAPLALLRLACFLQLFFHCDSPLHSSSFAITEMYERLHNKKFALAFSCAVGLVLLLLYISYASHFTVTTSFVFSQDASKPSITSLLGPTESAKHPIKLLVEEANEKFQAMRQQSNTFEKAITEYKRRYDRGPPPGFDHWYDATVKSNATVINNFDTIMATLEPFWGLSAQEMRARVKDLQKASEWKMVSMSIKNQTFCASNTQDVSGAHKYNAIKDWVPPYLQYIPDMELLFSSIDEARVVVPRDELDNTMKRYPRRPTSHDSDSKAQRVPIYFENLSFQRTWMTTTLSCPADSPSRPGIIPIEHHRLRFIRNITLAKDSCEHPSAAQLHSGFGPKATIRLLETLHPIFSRSKMSTYQDLLFPASDYAPSVHYKAFDPSKDIPWEDKSNTLYWAGATTGAEARKDNGRRNWQRERFVTDMNDKNRTILLLGQEQGPQSRWEVYEDEMDSLSHMIDLSITGTIHCDQETCDVMKKELHFRKEKEPAEAVYEHRFVMDIDGNAFTERFYRLLMSKSKLRNFLPDTPPCILFIPPRHRHHKALLRFSQMVSANMLTTPCPKLGTVFKMTMFQEWHDDRLIPCVHYVPITLKMTKLPETLRFLAETVKGQVVAKNIAEQGSKWALKVLRQEDLGLAVFRTLLEYGRLYGEERDRTGECPWSREME